MTRPAYVLLIALGFSLATNAALYARLREARERLDWRNWQGFERVLR